MLGVQYSLRMTRRIAVLVLAGCHVTTAIDDTRYGASQHVRHPERASARTPAAVLGGVLAARGGFATDPLGSPSTYAGAAAVAVGLPLAIGPWLGDTEELR